MTSAIRVFSALVFCCAMALDETATAAQFPHKPVRIVVGQPPGGSQDILARLLAAGLASKWGQPVLVENRAGASGAIGVSAVANATPDGHTILFAANHLVIPPVDGYKLGYDPIKSFIPISQIASSPDYLYVYPSLPAKTVQEFIALARARPGQMNFSASGATTVQDMIMKAFMDKTKINLTIVTYNGGAPAVAAVVSGEVQATFGSQGGGVPLVQAGKLRVLAITSIARSQLLPDVPTIAEAANLPGFNYVIWFGVLVPAGTPKEIIAQTYRDIVEVIRSSDSQRVMSKLGFITVANTPAEFARTINAEVHEFWGSRYGK